VFVAVNVALMYLMPGLETVPFHFVWISTTLVFGLRPWSPRRTYSTLLVVCLVTGAALVWHAQNEIIGWEEVTEVPLMACVFLAMVWHVRRRIAAVEEAERLAASERRMREEQKRFARFASHELRTPVTVARGYAELIRGEYPDPEVVQDAGIVLDELDKLERIASRLLTLSEVDDRVTMNVVPVDVDALLHRSITRWRAATDRQWTLECCAGSIRADPDRLETALDSLVENAVRHTEVHHRIWLTAHRIGAFVEIGVHDDGLGIEPDELDFIFEGFRSGGPRAGTGMGLAITKAIVEAHGGTVTAVSLPGDGATVTMRLPVNGPEASPPRPAAVPQRA
jgi:two-component system, OmpR family, sensor kinase